MSITLNYLYKSKEYKHNSVNTSMVEKSSEK